MAIFKTQIVPKLISRKIEWQITSCIMHLNFTFWKFLEQSAFLKKLLMMQHFCLPMLWFNDFQLKISKTKKIGFSKWSKKPKKNIQTWMQEKRFDIKNTKHMRVICEMQNKSKNINFNFKEWNIGLQDREAKFSIK